jgi:hypothetical protein
MAPAKRQRPDEAANEDEPFPRGGKSMLTPLEERKLKLKAKADFERESSLAGHTSKKKLRTSTDRADEEVRCRQQGQVDAPVSSSPGKYDDSIIRYREVYSRSSLRPATSQSLWTSSSSRSASSALHDALHASRTREIRNRLLIITNEFVLKG